jgi:hypothetical protein
MASPAAEGKSAAAAAAAAAEPSGSNPPMSPIAPGGELLSRLCYVLAFHTLLLHTSCFCWHSACTAHTIGA